MPTIIKLIKTNLTIKLVASVILITAASTTLISFTFFHEIYWPLLSIPLTSAGVLSLIVYLTLKPLEDLRQAALTFSRGELLHRVNIHSGDEIEDIAVEFNKMAENLGATLKNISTDKDVLGFERNKLNIVIASIIDGIIVLNLNKEIVLVNKAALDITGYSEGEMKSAPLEKLLSFANQDGLILQTKDIFPSTPTRDGTPFINNETFTLVGKSGKKTLVNLTSNPIHSSVQTDLGAVLILHSLEKERQLESIQLDFVSMASHELRTPLTSIIGYLSVFMEENQNTFNGNQKRFLDRIMISAKELSSLIDNLLSVSKVERGALVMNTQSVDWAKFLSQIVEENKVVASQKNISLTLQLDNTTLPPVKADTVRITEVINNLISNAINYTKNGGSITVSAKDIGVEVLTSVKDTGVGIPPDAINHLFTKFFRVSGALDKSSNSKGTGLGLYLSKEIIDMHHGRIWVESTVGQGSTFYFSLPKTDQTSPQINLPSPSLTPPPPTLP